MESQATKRTVSKGKEKNMNSSKKSSENKMDRIDAIVNAARAKKASRAEVPRGSSPEATDSGKKVKLSAEEKAARQAQRDAEKATKRAQREARRAEKNSLKATPHLAKVAKAASRLPNLSDTAIKTFNEVTLNFSREMVGALALHLQHFNRRQATERALGQKIEAGMKVRITAGDSRYVGQVATVTKAQRIRCYVSIPGVKKDVYLFTSDVEPATNAATGTEG